MRLHTLHVNSNNLRDLPDDLGNLDTSFPYSFTMGLI